jgi:single-strand DNA-binding protein
MNKVILVGRLTRDPEIRYTTGNEPMAVARYTLAVDRRGRRDNANPDQPTADFINIVAFRYNAEFAEKYLRKGTRILVEGRLQNDNYTNKEGQKVYSFNVIVDNHEFVDSKSQSGGSGDSFVPAPGQDNATDSGDGFMNIPDGIDEELPFS